ITSIRARADGLSPVIDLRRAIGEKTWRRNRDKNRQAPVPGQRLFGLNFFRRLRRKRFRRPIFAHRIESCRVSPGTRPALHDDHARSGHWRENAGDIETSRASSRRNGRRLRSRARRRNNPQRRSRRVVRLVSLSVLCPLSSVLCPLSSVLSPLSRQTLKETSPARQLFPWAVPPKSNDRYLAAR